MKKEDTIVVNRIQLVLKKSLSQGAVLSSMVADSELKLAEASRVSPDLALEHERLRTELAELSKKVGGACSGNGFWGSHGRRNG